MNRLQVILMVVLVLLVSACEQETGLHVIKQEEEKKLADTIPLREPDAFTIQMMERVATANARINVENMKYLLNEERAGKLLQQIQNTEGVSKLQLLISYAHEKVNAGYPDEGIQSLEQVLSEIKNYAIQNEVNTITAIKRELAIAYMRKGEQDNCLVNHTAASCIIPISEEGQHRLKEGSSKAIEMLVDVLAVHPDDKECQYLLNVAHMTLGQYPDMVPKQFRIPEEYFNKNGQITKFKDIAMNVGVDALGLAGGIILDDFNNDGYLDIMASSWGMEDQIRYFQHDGEGGFVDRTRSTG